MEKYIPKANNDDEISLENLIKQDSKLKYIYDKKSFLLKVDEQEYWLKSQILKNTRDILYIRKQGGQITTNLAATAVLPSAVVIMT